jgi:hypothetical protein
MLFSMLNVIIIIIIIIIIIKGKCKRKGEAIPLQAWTGTVGFRRFPDFKTMST